MQKRGGGREQRIPPPPPKPNLPLTPPTPSYKSKKPCTVLEIAESLHHQAKSKMKVLAYQVDYRGLHISSVSQ